MPQGNNELVLFLFWLNCHGEPISMTILGDTTLEVSVDTIMFAHAKPIDRQIEISNSRLEGVLFNEDTTTCWKLHKLKLLVPTIKKSWERITQEENSKSV